MVESFFVYVINLFGCKTRFSYICVIAWETVIKALAVAYTDNVTNFIPKVIRIKAIGCGGGMGVVKFAVAPCKSKAIGRVGERARAYHRLMWSIMQFF